MKTVSSALLLIATFCLATAAEPLDGSTLSIIPQPAKLERLPGSFLVTPETLVVADPQSARTARQLVQYLQPAMGFELKSSGEPGAAKSTITLQEDALLAALGGEGYRLQVRPEGIRIVAAGQAGLFYGVQSLRQLLAPAIFGSAPVAGGRWTVPAVSIEDAPRFPWRGYMLDCGHAFQTVDYVKRFLDLMAIHKLNTFHWHLTDNCTWAMEIKGYPQLTSPAARVPAVKAPGYYTQSEIRDVVDYAAGRHITIVPEIDVPGHSTAALLACPELRCPVPDKVAKDGKPVPVKSYCAGNEKTYEFLEAVFSQVMELFPGPYVHIGADEVGKASWEQCPLCQARLKREHLSTAQDLQGYFTRRIGRFLQSKGRRVVGWQEIMQGGMDPGTTVMSWTSMDAGIAAAQQGHDVVMAPQAAVYFGSASPALYAVYRFDPAAPGKLTPAQAAHVLGGQACRWGGLGGELSESDNDQSAFPRIAALSEALWTPAGGRDYDEFVPRLQAQLARYAELGVAIGRYETAPGIGTWEIKTKMDSPQTMEWPIEAGLIKAAGSYRIKFLADKGNALWVRSVEILQDSKVLAASPVAEFNSSAEAKNNPCPLILPAFGSGPLTLRASVCPKAWDRKISRGIILIEKVR